MKIFKEYLQEAKTDYIIFMMKGKNMGRKTLTSYSEQGLEIKSWIESGGDIKYNGQLYNDISRIKDFY